MSEKPKLITRHDEPLTSSHSSLDDALAALERDKVHRAFLIGGAQLYNLALQASPPLVDRVLLTRVTTDFECDTFLHDFSTQTDLWRLASHEELSEWVGWPVAQGDIEEKGVRYRYEMWVRR
jgi:dihydrofolate reductase